MPMPRNLQMLQTKQKELDVLLAQIKSMGRAVPDIPRPSEGGEGHLKLLLAGVFINSLLRAISFFSFQNIPYETFLKA